MLSFNNRFHGHGSLRYVYKNGAAVRTHAITVKYAANKRRKNSRFAVVISKKVLKSAVRRNTIRRRIYEIIRQELPAMKQVHDVVVLVFSAEVLAMSHTDLHQTLKDIFHEADLY